MRDESTGFLSDARLAGEMERCLYCAEKPCRSACPVDCSPADFIMAARAAAPSDFRRAAALIMGANPLGGVCGGVCPEFHCMAACARATFDRPVEIPSVQATIIAKARRLGVMPSPVAVAATGRRVAVVGAGPAGYGAAAVLARCGHAVVIIEAAARRGGMAALIPLSRLDPEVLAGDMGFVESLGAVEVRTGTGVSDPAALLSEGFDAVLVTTGLDRPLRLGIPGEEMAFTWTEVLTGALDPVLAGRCVAVVGGGGVAVDCAEAVSGAGAREVELIALETLAEMPLTTRERASLLVAGMSVSGRTRVTRILGENGQVSGIETVRVTLPEGESFSPGRVVDVAGTGQRRPEIDAVVIAIGARSSHTVAPSPGVFVAGDVVHGPTTVVEAVAAGKNAARDVGEYLGTGDRGPGTGPRPPEESVDASRGGRRKVKSTVLLAGFRRLPVPLDADFFGRAIPSPLLLSAGPPSDGYEQMRLAYDAGWAGGVMKTAFDNVPIHIPSRYMVAFDGVTFGNCDNVSAHSLDRVCGEVERLRREFPDRLTMASTGGPVTGDDGADAWVWQSNTRKLEAAGACGIEYSLSCPQGGDGTKGDIVSQDAELTARIIGWVLATGDPGVPKLFKLTAAVTSVHPIMAAIARVLERFPRHKVGVTLANTFPTLTFRPGTKEGWDEGIVVGMSGAGVAPISFLTVANAARWGVPISANAGAMDYRSCAHFLALGAGTVQLCSAVMKHGYGIVDDLHSGLSHLLESRGLTSVGELIGCAGPDPITPFDALPAVKQISSVDEALCQHCGNCTRCPYLAISLDERGFPRTDPERCIGCSFCTLMCFAGALGMRERTPGEASALRET